MGWWEAVPAIATAAGSAFGAVKQNEYSDQALGLQRDAYNKALGLLEGGLDYTPERAAGVGATSAMAGAAPDPLAASAQADALSGLQEASREGYNEIDKAAINALLGDVNQQERGNREAALSRLDPGSGAAIGARLSAQQTSANRGNQQALQIAGMSRKRALDALAGYGNLATGMRGQSFGEAAKRAEAQDAINRFNAETSRFNAGGANAARASGIANRLGAAGVLRGATGDLAGGLNARGQMAFNQAAGAGGMTGNAIAAYGESTKDDDEDED